MRKIDEIKNKMVSFTCHKTVKAVPMNRKDYNDLRGWSVPSNENPEDEGYLVEYQDDSHKNVEGFDGYISWSPKVTFDNGYTISETFGDRLRLEYIDLLERIKKLDAFIGSISISHRTIKPVELELLSIQLNAMRTYARVLKARLVLLTPTY